MHSKLLLAGCEKVALPVASTTPAPLLQRTLCCVFLCCACVFPYAQQAQSIAKRLCFAVLQVMPGPDRLLLNAIECSGRQDDVRLMELLLQRGLGQGLRLELVNERGETALHAAVRNGNAKVSTAYHQRLQEVH
jgi:hypothetical protein